MPLSVSTDRVDTDQREMLTYGSAEFPIAFFDDDLSVVRVPWHWHTELELTLVAQGSIDFSAGSARFTLRAGEGCFTGSGVLHAERSLTGRARQKVMVLHPRLIAPEGDRIYREYVQPALDSARLPFVRLSPAIPWQREALRHMDAAWYAGAHDQEDYPITVRENLTRFFRMLTGNLDALESEYALSSREQRTGLRLKKALGFLEARYTEPLTIEQIAASANISVSTCLRIFHEVLHTTPIQYLNEYRLSRIARELSFQDGRTVSEIAFAHGFSDMSYFNRCFRRRYGMTPTAWRERQASRD